MKIHAGDMVVIITGKEKGKTGRVLKVLPESGRLVVAGANMRTKFVKRTPNQPGRRLHFEGALDASNVMIVDPDTGKRSRIGYRAEESPSFAPGGAMEGKKKAKGMEEAKGRKERFAKRSGKALMSGKTLRRMVEEEQEKDSKTPRFQDSKEAKLKKEPKKPVEEKATAPKRSAFWERLGWGGRTGEETGEGKEGGGEVRRHDQSTRKAPTGER
jgi:large subunit ribosomal protein L24